MIRYDDMIDVNHSKFWNVRDELQGLPLDEIRSHQPILPYSVCVLNLTGELNLASCMRNAVLFGAEKFYIAGRKTWDRRSGVGANNYIELEKISALKNETEFDIDLILTKIQNDGYSPVLCETGGVSLRKFEFPNRPCFMFGNEGLGLPQEIIDKVTNVVTIPQIGVMRSLNVSNACAIILYEFVGRL